MKLIHKYTSQCWQSNQYANELLYIDTVQIVNEKVGSIKFYA